jgi:predicted AAA+ superfamily ATPase
MGLPAYEWEGFYMLKERSITEYIIQDLHEKMVFIGGARQVGKTTLATDLVARHFQSHGYFNWDNKYDRKIMMSNELPAKKELLIFDEIHKYKKWKGFIKGLYDSYKKKYKFLVTGSSRLDVYRKGGDSLLGRYHYYRLHPFSLAEMVQKRNDITVFKEILISSDTFYEDFLLLDKFGGFPEVLVKQDSRILRRWHNERTERLFR